MADVTYGYEQDGVQESVLEEERKAEDMPATLEEFLIENPVENLTEKITLCERLENFEFEIGSMTQTQRDSYSNACVIRSGSGKVIRQNTCKFNELVVLNHCLYPNFNSVDFIRKCGCKTPAEALHHTLKVGEVEQLAQKILEFNGFSEFEDLRKQAKN